MATTAVSSTTTSATSTSAATTATTTAAATAAANRANAQKIMNTLGAGSGVDVNALAQSLVDAEKLPRQNEINTKISKSDAKVSGYSAVSFSLNALSTAFAALKDTSGFTGVSASSNSAAFSATATGTAQVASHDIEVLSLAKPQRTLSNGFLTNNYPLNVSGSASAPMTLTLTLAGALSTDIPVSASQATPAGVVTSINAMSAKTGVKAILVNTGDQGQAAVPSVSKLSTPFPAVVPAKTSDDYGDFTVTVGGQTMVVPKPNPAVSDINSYAAVLQTALQAQDTTSVNQNITVTVDVDGGLLVHDARGRTLSGLSLKNADGLTDSGLAATTVTAGALGVSAKPYKIMLTGPTGQAQNFTMSAKDTATGNPVSGLDFSGAPLQSASDASIKVDGISYRRSSNSLKDVIDGVTLDLKNTTALSGPGVLDLVRDTTPVKDKLKALVSAYNDANSVLNVVSDPKSTVDQFGASLVGDSTVRRIRDQMRAMVTGSSSTPSNGFSQIWQFGISLDQTGALTTDDTKMEAALQSNFNDAVAMFTGGTDNLSTYSTQPAGLAGDAVKKLTALTSKTGFIQQQSDSATAQSTKYKDDLTKLDTRMQTLLDRYTKQFGVMNSLVGQTNSLKTSLKSTFDGMMATYTNK
jgi:flagellar hook-associated protein 2